MIRSASEFEIVMSAVVSKTARLLDEHPRSEPLLGARRMLDVVEQAFRRGAKLPARDVEALGGALETIRRLGRGDPDLGERLHDFLDYVEDELAEPAAG